MLQIRQGLRHDLIPRELVDHDVHFGLRSFRGSVADIVLQGHAISGVMLMSEYDWPSLQPTAMAIGAYP